MQLGFSEDGQKEALDFARMLENELLNTTSDGTSADFVDLLRAWAPRTREDPLPLEVAYAFASGVHVLEQRGELVVDEYNGVWWAWTAKGDPKTSHSERGPVSYTRDDGTDDRAIARMATSPAAMGAVMDYLRDTPKAQGKTDPRCDALIQLWGVALAGPMKNPNIKRDKRLRVRISDPSTSGSRN